MYKALERLKDIRAVRVQRMHNGRSGKSAGFIEQELDLGPILYDRQGWIEDVGELLPDGPGIHSRNREALDFVNRLRKASKLKPLSQSNGKSSMDVKSDEGEIKGNKQR